MVFGLIKCNSRSSTVIELQYTEVTRWFNSLVYSSSRDASWAAVYLNFDGRCVYGNVYTVSWGKGENANIKGTVPRGQGGVKGEGLTEARAFWAVRRSS